VSTNTVFSKGQSRTGTGVLTKELGCEEQRACEQISVSGETSHLHHRQL
jgi:hypothetical protein